MSLNATPSGERIHIGLFGKRNVGKSSLINALTKQDLAIISDVKGTTTDPVLKAMELLPLGPVIIIDTSGLDDTECELGKLRVEKSYQMLNKTDIALLVLDAKAGMTQEDEEILNRIKEKKIPYILVFNKVDTLNSGEKKNLSNLDNAIYISAKTKENIELLKRLITKQIPDTHVEIPLVKDLVSKGDFVVLVVPVDLSAPKGRIILPQQQVIRDLLDIGAISLITKDTELESMLASVGKKPSLVITDSQVFASVAKIVPKDILLTSFSILFSRYKGELETQVFSAKVLDDIEDGDCILISEGCTHHRQCDDIGTVKLPKLIKKHTGKNVEFEFTSGTEFPSNFSKYKMIIHCGACTLNDREMKYRIKCAKDASIPITNYGTALAYMNGILDRTLEVFNR